MGIKITIKLGEAELKLKSPYSPKEFSDFMEVYKTLKNVEAFEKNKEKVANQRKFIQQKKSEPAVEKKEEPEKKQGVSKVVPLGEDRGTFPLGEIIESKLAEKKEVANSIKTDEDGTKRYKLRYQCSECGDKGNHYIPDGTDAVNCWNCGVDMFVEPATDEKLEPNEFGNYFIGYVSERWDKGGKTAE